MAMVIRVRFKRASKLYDFDPAGLDLHNGMHVVTETARGVELGECMSGIMEVPDEHVAAPLKPIMRIATEQDMLTQKRNEEYEKDAFDIAIERIAEHNLEMKLVDVEYAFDHSKIIFYFTANGRVDFRLLVKNLASIFKTRIELRQIGVRDEAKMLGGIGPCGRPICCRTFLSDFTPVSIKMAKEQNLSLNPTKISGLCDRLMCCLKYEQDQYEATRKRMPRVGREIITPDGVGTINAINVLEETVRVRIAVGDSFELRQYPIDDCQRVEPQGSAQERGEKQERAEKQEKAERPERAEKPEKAEKQDKSEKAEKPEKAERREKLDKPERNDKQERLERREKPDRQDKGEKADKNERREKNEKGDKGEKREKGERPERGPKPQKQNRPERGEKPGKPEHGEQQGEKQNKQRPEKRMKPQKPAEKPVALAAETAHKAVKPVEAATLEIVEDTGVEDLL